MTVPSGTPLVSIIVPAFNLWGYTRRCLEAIARHTTDVPHEVIVVDDASTDETRRELPRLFPGVRLLRNEANQGFARNNNAAAAIARGRYVCFLNNDTEVHAGWLGELVRVAESDPAIGMVGCKLLFPDGTIQHAGVAIAYAAPDPIVPFHLHDAPGAGVVELKAVTAACALMPRDLFVAVGGFDEGFLMGYEDVDLCFKVRAHGRRVVYTPAAIVTHHESISEGRFVANRRNLERLHANWLGRFDDFDFDARKLPAPERAPSDRPGASVVVVVCDELSSVAPALENLLLDLRAQDELVVVDDGSRGATASFVELFAARRADQVRRLRHEQRRGFAAATCAGLAAASRRYAVVLPPTLRLLSGTLDRLVAHLDARPDLGVICPVEADAWSVDVKTLVAPLPRSAGGLELPSPRPSSELPRARFAASACFAGDRARLLACAAAPALLGDDPAALSDALAREGLALGVADDVPVYPLTQVFPSSGPQARRAYLEALVRLVRDEDRALCSVVVVARDHDDVLERCLAALAAHTRGNVELIVVDDGSARDLRGAIAPARVGDRPARVVRNEVSRGLAAASNQGLALARGEIAVVMNGDVIVTHGWLDRLRAALAVSPGIGIAGPASNVGPGPQLAGSFDLGPDVAPAPLDACADQRATDSGPQVGGVLRLPGVCLALRRALLDRVGGFDPRYGDEGGDADDLCLRAARAGFRVALAYGAYVHHERRLPPRHLALHPKRPAPRGWLRFSERWRHPPDARSAEDVVALFRAGTPFDPATDRIPLDAPTKKAFTLATTARHRVLAWPRGATDARALADTFGPEIVDRADVCLCVRHDPFRDGALADAAQALEAAFAARFGASANVDVLFVDDALDDGGWAALGRAVTAAVALPSSQEPDRAARLAQLGRPLLGTRDELRAALSGTTPRTLGRRRADPTVSVITPTHDRPEFLARALGSLARQSFRDFEVIVVNDAGRSIDDVVDRFRGELAITTVRHGTNLDRSAARNTGLRLARGRYVAYLDDDDLYRPDHLEVLVDALRRGPHRVAYTDATILREERTPTGYRVVGTEPMQSQDFDRDALLVLNYIPVLALMHERSLLDEVGAFDEELGTHEDWELFIRLALAHDFAHVRRTTVEISMRSDGSTTTSGRRADFARTARVIYDRYRDAVKDRPDLQELRDKWLAMMTLPSAA